MTSEEAPKPLPAVDKPIPSFEELCQMMKTYSIPKDHVPTPKPRGLYACRTPMPGSPLERLKDDIWEAIVSGKYIKIKEIVTTYEVTHLKPAANYCKLTHRMSENPTLCSLSEILGALSKRTRKRK